MWTILKTLDSAFHPGLSIASAIVCSVHLSIIPGTLAHIIPLLIAMIIRHLYVLLLVYWYLVHLRMLPHPIQMSEDFLAPMKLSNVKFRIMFIDPWIFDIALELRCSASTCRPAQIISDQV